MTDPDRSISDSIKLFAMKTQLLDKDLARIERDFQVSLGRITTDDEDADDAYYPQFDEDLRREAAEMAKHYEVFYCLEKSVRRFISDTLEAEAGQTWWEKGKVPALIHQEVAKRMQKEVDSAVTVRSSEPLDFTNFGELGELIKANWDLFGSSLEVASARWNG